MQYIPVKDDDILIGDSEFNENLVKFLDEVNTPLMREIAGKEKSISVYGNIERVGSQYGGFRYLYRNLDREIVGALQGVNINGDNIISNVYVRPDYRRHGIMTELAIAAQSDRPNIMVDSHFSGSGAGFFKVIDDDLNPGW